MTRVCLGRHSPAGAAARLRALGSASWALPHLLVTGLGAQWPLQRRRHPTARISLGRSRGDADVAVDRRLQK